MTSPVPLSLSSTSAAPPPKAQLCAWEWAGSPSLDPHLAWAFPEAEAPQAPNTHFSSVDLGRIPPERLPRGQDLEFREECGIRTWAAGGRALAHLVGPLASWLLQEPEHGCLGGLGQALQEGAVVLRAVDRGGRCGAFSLLWWEEEGGLAQDCGTPGPPPVRQGPRRPSLCPKTLHPPPDGSCLRRKTEGGVLRWTHLRPPFPGGH